MSRSFASVCVVGGGPAGLAAAIALRRQGCKVTLVDCTVPPADKACGEGLMPDSIAALHQMGIELPDEVGCPFRGIRFTDGSSSVTADFPVGVAKGVRRTALHWLMVQHAADLGVSLFWNARNVRLLGTGISFDGHSIHADLIVGADGQNSHVRRQAALDEVAHEKRRFGFRRHYRIAPWSPYMELHWGPTSQIYVTPVSPGEVCLAVISRNSRFRLDQALDDFPDLKRRVHDAEPASRELGALSVSRRLRRVQKGKVALIGDASGSVDAITGEGMCLGLKQAQALASAVKSGNLAAYEQTHRALMRRPRAMSSLMLTLEHPGLQRRVLAGLARSPQTFESLLAVHVGAVSFKRICSFNLLGFGRAILAG